MIFRDYKLNVYTNYTLNFYFRNARLRSLVLENEFEILVPLFSAVYATSNGPPREKTCLLRFVNNKGADQPVHLRSLISAFAIYLLESIISRLATSKILIF